MFQRPANNHLSAQQNGAIIALHQRNAPAVRIARDIGCHRNTVTNWINRYLNTFDVNRQIGSRRPRITTPEQDAKIFQTLRAKPFTSLQEIKGDIFLYAPQTCGFIVIFFIVLRCMRIAHFPFAIQ
jgi:transposase